MRNHPIVHSATMPYCSVSLSLFLAARQPAGRSGQHAINLKLIIHFVQHISIMNNLGFSMNSNRAEQEENENIPSRRRDGVYPRSAGRTRGWSIRRFCRQRVPRLIACACVFAPVSRRAASMLNCSYQQQQAIVQ